MENSEIIYLVKLCLLLEMFSRTNFAEAVFSLHNFLFHYIEV